MQTRSQEIAAGVHHLIQEKVASKSQPIRAQYRSMVEGLPVLIHNSGLVQALAFVASRKTESTELLLDHLARTLDFADRETMLNRSRSAPLAEYIQLTRRTIAALEWYKAYAQMLLKEQKNSTTTSATAP